MRGQSGVKLVEHDAGLHGDAAGIRVESDDIVEVLADIDDQRLADGLAALRGATAARQDGDAFLGGDLNGAVDVGLGLRYQHADRFNLVVRGVG